MCSWYRGFHKKETRSNMVWFGYGGSAVPVSAAEDMLDIGNTGRGPILPRDSASIRAPSRGVFFFLFRAALRIH